MVNFKPLVLSLKTISNATLFIFFVYRDEIEKIFYSLLVFPTLSPPRVVFI